MGITSKLLKFEDTPLESMVRVLRLHELAERLLLPRTIRFRIDGTPVDFTIYRLKLYLARAGVDPDEDLNLEGYLSELFLKSVPDGGVVYDVGADHGYYTLAAGIEAGPDGRVYAFEPHPVNFKATVKNVRQNDVPATVRVEPIALMDADSPDSIDLDQGRPVWSSSGGVAETTTLDEYVTDERPPDLVKIDVEGSEYRVLNGGKETLVTHHPELLIEVHEWKLPEFGDDVEKLYQLLEDCGYSLRRIRNPWGSPEIETSFEKKAIGTERTYYVHAVSE